MTIIRFHYNNYSIVTEGISFSHMRAEKPIIIKEKYKDDLGEPGALLMGAAWLISRYIDGLIRN